MLAIYSAFTFNWEQLPFLVGHCVKAGITLVSLLCAFHAHAATWRLAGIHSLGSPLNVLFAGRVTGYPTAFYVLQGFAVAATIRFRATGWKHAGAAILTWAFTALSSVLLFAPLDAALSFYDNHPPDWLGFAVPPRPQ